ncbi:MAG TPA: molybdenum cofactor guanylyltransferase [Solirubrobacteraceae bacterium]|nr:molybdenum cofactor guanylyltransferase [Solirubrobacteraceae bacterium]
MARPQPIGVLLAGGRAVRMGGDKAALPLAGRPLAAWPLAALRAALDDVVVVAKAATALPALDAEVWVEPDEPAHPRAGLVHALERAGGRAILACAVDLPLSAPPLVRRLAGADAGGAPAVDPRAAGRLQPLLARYEPAALEPLRAAPPGQALTATVAALHPHVVELDDDAPFFNVNTPADLEAATQRIARPS